MRELLGLPEVCKKLTDLEERIKLLEKPTDCISDPSKLTIETNVASASGEQSTGQS